MRAPNPPSTLLSLSALLALSALPVLAAPPPESPYATPQPPFYGQVRTRTEYDVKAMADTSTK